MRLPLAILTVLIVLLALVLTACEKQTDGDMTLEVMTLNSESIRIPPKTRDYIPILSSEKAEALLVPASRLRSPMAFNATSPSGSSGKPMVLPEPDLSFTLPRFQPLRLMGPPVAETFGWFIHKDGEWRWVDDAPKFDYVFSKVGTYRFKAHLTKGYRSADVYFEVHVEQEKTPYLPYASRLVEFMPAPGQFRGVFPKLDLNDPNTWNTEEKRLALVYKQILENTKDKAFAVSLGSFGGYISYAFDHTIADIPGKPDLFIPGNGFKSITPGYPDWSEPGIVMVAYDYNGNGKPDEDEWRTLKGEDYDNPINLKNYEVTYYKPKNIYRQSIRWKDNRGNRGWVKRNRFHNQPYWPIWLTVGSYTLKGTLLAFKPGFDKGYVDGTDHADWKNETFKVEDADFDPPKFIRLPGIDFVRVYSAYLKDGGDVGEYSTEVGNVYDLNLYTP